MMTALLILFGLLNLADGYTTWHVLRFGGYERNKVIVWLMERMGRYWALVFIKVVPVAAIWWLLLHGLPVAVVAIACVVYAVQVYWNYEALQKHKNKQ